MGLSLDRIEINGFKSFANKVDIKLDKGVTVIVGPNGSGKSNIVDAIRWVLGEKSAKALRGSKMQDVIFSGVEGKKAKSFCDVSLTFDNSSNQLPLNYAEVCVTRRVFRSGEGEYYINQSKVRRRDIVDLFRDTGIGKEGYSIIGQGRVDEILSPKSEDRRIVLEEAAGISKYKSRKVEAERKLTRSEENLSGIFTVLSELENLIGPLEIQSEKASEYLLLREQAKAIDIAIFLDRFDEIYLHSSESKEVLAQLNDELSSVISQKNKLTQALASKELNFEEIETRLGSANSMILEKSTEISRLEGQKNLLEQKKQSAKENRERIKADIARLLDETTKLNSALNSSDEMDAHIIDMRIKLENEISEIDEELEKSGAEIDVLEETIERQKDEIMAAINNRANAKIELNRLENMISTLHEKMQTLVKEKNSELSEIEELETEKLELEKMNTQLREVLEKANSEESENKQLIEKYKDTRFKLSNYSHTLEKELQVLQSRKNLLADMKKDYEGYYFSVKKLMKDIDKNPELNNGISGVLGELIEVPEGLETAVEMALGSSLQSIVCENENSAKKAIDHLRRMKYGRATFLPITTIKSRTLNNSEKASLDASGVVGIASELVSFDEKYRNVVESVLGRTVIVDDLDVGISLARNNRNSFRIVSQKGDVINAGGAMSGGSLQKKENRILGRDKEISSLEQNILDTKDKIEENSHDKNICEKKLAELALKRSDLAQKLDDINPEMIRQDEKRNTLDSLLASHKSGLAEAENNILQVNDMIEDLKSQIKEAEHLDDVGVEGGETEKQEIKASQKRLYEMKNKRETLRESLGEKTIENERIKNSIVNHEQEKKRIAQNISQNNIKMSESEDEIKELIIKIEEMTAQKHELSESLEQNKTDLEAVNREYKEDNEIKASLNADIKIANKDLDNSRINLDDIQSRIADIELKMHKGQIELDNIQDRIWNDYELTYDGALGFKDATREEPIDKKLLESVRQRMRALGDVNISAIEDYKNVKERYDELNRQKDDIIEASEDLKKVIAELEKKMGKQFKEEFDKINKNFSHTFRKLFGGGKAELRMEDSEDALNCEIEIVAQPPGKNLQLMTLLSGGERALTAIALLFAMLQLKATPFCVLDEIEASLDEANVERFADFVKDYSKKTQFIMVTHRKGSMMIGEALYGVAMEGTGVSRMVSVKMSEAEKMLDS